MKSSSPGPLSRVAGVVQRLRLEKWTVLAVVTAFVVGLAAILLTTEFRSLGVPPADWWPAGRPAERDYVVEHDYTYTDQDATYARRQDAARRVAPVFVVSPAAAQGVLDDMDQFAQVLVRQVRAGASPAAVRESLPGDLRDRVAPADLAVLLQTRVLSRALQHARGLMETALTWGIVDLIAHADQAAAAGAIEVRRMQDGRLQGEQVLLKDVVSRDNAAAQVEARLLPEGTSVAERRAVRILVDAFAEEDAPYDDVATRQRQSEARAAVQPVTEKLSRGEVLVHRGEVVSDAQAARIRALSDYARVVDVNGIVGEALFLLVVLLVALFLFTMKPSPVLLRRGHALVLLALGLAYIIIASLVARFVAIPGWMPASVALPTGAMSMLVSILVATPVGVFFSLAVSLALLPLTGMSIQAFLFAFLGGIAGTAVVMRADKRIDLVRAGMLLAAAEGLVLLVLGLLGNYEPRMVAGLVGGGLANGFLCGILTLGFLPVLELILNEPTRFKLMELSDLNSPVFKRMLSQAPGTYTHSISVANLAETACEAIGANALLARVSAYYHDIGKVEQADYFVENQKARNRHDDMRPSLSVAVIKSHVRIGIEKARELNLPQAIIDIIAQHHGRGLITYFYHRAVKEGRSPRVSRDDYTYPGVRPRSKEAAVLMLADTVEAACRSLKRPTESRIERIVQDMVMEKFNSGDLNDSTLTLRDLELIRRSFVHILEGTYHTRIEYPKMARTTAGTEGTA
ncbi:MAG TPA: HDIG domain-containing protein [Spirochaetia bacterium]|nr:HDIG domain-containing protein [Spirochaetia bacterium]